MNNLHAYDSKGKRLPAGQGICGGNGSLCAQCYDAEVAEQSAIMQSICAANPRRPNEDLGAYWHRVNGEFLDCWYYLASIAPVA